MWIFHLPAIHYLCYLVRWWIQFQHLIHTLQQGFPNRERNFGRNKQWQVPVKLWQISDISPKGMDFKNVRKKANIAYIYLRRKERTTLRTTKVSTSTLEKVFFFSSRKKIFTVRMVRHWTRFPREVVDKPFLELFKAKLEGTVQPALVEGIPAHSREDEIRWSSKSTSNISMILCPVSHFC